MFKKNIIALVTTALFAFSFIGCDEENSTSPIAVNSANFTVTVENVSTAYPFIHSGSFNTPVGASAPGPAFPGDSYQFEFTAAPGMKLSFATMMVQSNDLFYAPDENGIELFDQSGNQITGDITSQIMLWDSGTEINQEPGLGMDQAPRQSGANTGAADPNNTVRLASDDFGNLPAVSDVIKVTLSSTSATGFMVTIENVSTSATLQTSDGASHPVPIAPGVFVVHTDSKPLFAQGQPDYSKGLEGLAEDGAISMLAADVSSMTGITSPFAPGVYAVFTMSNPLFMSGQNDSGEGLEALAEDGSPASLAGNAAAKNNVVSSGAFTNPVGSSSAGPIFPGDSYQFSFTAEEGQKLTFATMLVQSNDIFASPAESGIDLFTNGTALNGDITAQVFWYDAGTEVNEEPGIGLNQAPRQSGPNSGADENGTVRLLSNVNDGYMYPAVSNTVKITVQAN